VARIATFGEPGGIYLTVEGEGDSYIVYNESGDKLAEYEVGELREALAFCKETIRREQANAL
jgi:hypothetical protein